MNQQMSSCSLRSWKAYYGSYTNYTPAYKFILAPIETSKLVVLPLLFHFTEFNTVAAPSICHNVKTSVMQRIGRVTGRHVNQ